MSYSGDARWNPFRPVWGGIQQGHWAQGAGRLAQDPPNWIQRKPQPSVPRCSWCGTRNPRRDASGACCGCAGREE